MRERYRRCEWGLVIGECLAEALGDKAGITRFGHAYVPLDEALSSWPEPLRLVPEGRRLEIDAHH